MKPKSYIEAKAKAREIMERAARIPYNPNWTLLEQNQLHAAKELAELIAGFPPSRASV